MAGGVQHVLRSLTTDPAIGNSALFAPQLSTDGDTFSALRFDYAAPPWLHRPQNWIGVFPRGASPTGSSLLQWVYAPRGVGSVLLSASGKAPLPPGQYDAWYFFDNGYTTLSARAVLLALT
jgi:phospholipase C